MDIFPPGVVIAKLKLHATGNTENVDIKTITVPWGENKTPRDVEALRVAGRCDGTNIDAM